jgi:conjugative relaxase-like TrwC/TraI family protein
MSSGQASYYLGLAREDYYVSGGEPPGHWTGSGAASLGLTGEVDPDQLYNLFDGLSPDGSRSLFQKQRHEGKASHRPGWDLTFSAPKSVSALWSQASEENRQKVQAAHDSAVKAALEYLQETAAFTRRGSRGLLMEPAGLVVAMFEHSTSRALDPQLHTHALVMNIGVRHDGTTGTISSLSLFLSKMVAGALYRAELAAQLENQLGVPIERKRTWFEVSTVQKNLVEEFSKRRAAVQESMQRKGVATPQAAAVSALETREAKEDVSRKELFAAWHDEGRRHGWTTPDADKLFGAHRPFRDVGKESRLVNELVTKRLTHEVAHFSERDFVRYAAEESQCRGLSAKTVVAASGKHLRMSPDIVRLGIHHGEERYTTREMLELESSLIRHATALQANRRHIVPVQDVMHQLSQVGQLSLEQAQALWHITHETGGLAIVSGMAGTGKTTMLDVARAVWESQGFTVLGEALAARAASELREGAHMESATIAKLLYDIERGKNKLNSQTVVVVDEAGMVATPDMERLTRLANDAGAKLVLIGDERQLQPIGPGAPFLELGARFGRSELSEIIRQNEAWARQAVKDVADGNATAALEAFAKRGMVKVSETKTEAMTELVKEWQRDGLPIQNTLLIAGTRKEVQSINELAQRSRIEAGQLSGPSATVKGERWFVGDRLIFNENRKTLGVVNGDKATVESILGNGIRVRLDSGKRVSFDPLAENVTLGYATTTHKGQGATATRVYVLTGGPMQDREISYVQASRARERTTFFVTAAEVGDTIANLAREMKRSRQKQMAHSVLRLQERLPEQDIER